MAQGRKTAEPWKEPLHDPGPVVIFDVDGVLADMKPFAHLVEADRAAEKNWKAFHGKYQEAKPIRSGIVAAQRIFNELDIDLAYSTTRREQYARKTLWWMLRHDVPMGPMQLRQLIKDGPRPADEVKLRHWRNWQRKYGDKNPVLAWIEDDPHCRNLLQKHGCPAWGHRELRRAELEHRSLRAALDAGPIDWDTLSANSEATYDQWKQTEDEWEAKRRQWWEEQRKKLRSQRRR